MVGEVGRQSPSPRQPFTVAAMRSVTAWIPVEHIRDRYDYKPLTGELVVRRTGNVLKPFNRCQVQLNYRGDRIWTSLGRVVYAWYVGEWPEPTVDHIDRDPWNNRIWNLRPATALQQAQNTSVFNGGAHNDKTGWRVRPRIRGERKSLGTFNTKEEAQAAYAAALSELAS